ncbi:MAG: hypothetical protein HYX92_03100 [Chloroflexi bacterium]|nr:hypothetical protein [Chloroflexota bacterium]
MFGLEVLNPVAVSQGELEKYAPAPRPDTLNGKTVGLLWNSKRGGEVALAKAGELLQSRFRDAKLVRYDGSVHCETELLKQVKKDCDVVIGSTGD